MQKQLQWARWSCQQWIQIFLFARHVLQRFCLCVDKSIRKTLHSLKGKQEVSVVRGVEGAFCEPLCSLYSIETNPEFRYQQTVSIFCFLMKLPNPLQPSLHNLGEKYIPKYATNCFHWHVGTFYQVVLSLKLNKTRAAHSIIKLI